MNTIKLESTIESLSKDLKFTGVSREEYLAQCAYQRIEQTTQKYDQQFDHYLSLIETTELSYKDLHRLSESLKSLSSLITSSYDGLLKELHNCQRTFFDRRNK